MATGNGVAVLSWCLILEQAEKDKATREKILQRIEQTIEALGDQKGRAHKKAVWALRSHRAMGCSIRKTKIGRLKINQAKVKEEGRLDGKSLLSTFDDPLSAEKVASGYKEFMEGERAFRTLKTTLKLRPIFHREDERIRFPGLFCFLALLLVRIAEQETGETWDQVRPVME